MHAPQYLTYVEESEQIFAIKSYSEEAAINDVRHIYYNEWIKYYGCPWSPDVLRDECDYDYTEKPYNFEATYEIGGINDARRAKITRSHYSDYAKYLEECGNNKTFLSNKIEMKDSLKTYIVKVTEKAKDVIKVEDGYSDYLDTEDAEGFEDEGGACENLFADAMYNGFEISEAVDSNYTLFFLYNHRDIVENHIKFEIIDNPKARYRFIVSFNKEGTAIVRDNGNLCTYFIKENGETTRKYDPRNKAYTVRAIVKVKEWNALNIKPGNKMYIDLLRNNFHYKAFEKYPYPFAGYFSRNWCINPDYSIELETDHCWASSDEKAIKKFKRDLVKWFKKIEYTLMDDIQIIKAIVE